MENLLFKSLCILNFLCFGGTEEHKLNLNKNNLIIGQNNSGKSAILKVFRLLTSGLYHNMPDREYKGLAFAAAHGHKVIQLEDKHLYYGTSEGYFKFYYDKQESLEVMLKFSKANGYIKKELFFPSDINDKFSEEKQALIDDFDNNKSSKIIYIPSNRKIGRYLSLNEAKKYLKESQEFGEEIYDGSQLFPNILNWCNPSSFKTEEYRKKIEELEKYCGEILGFEIFRIRPVSEERTIYLEFDGTEVAIENAGYGIQQVMIIAAAMLIYRDRLILLEEPEIGLHPTIQRRLLAKLFKETTQLICTTHSNHVFDENFINREDLAYFQTLIDKNSGIAEIKELEENILDRLQVLIKLGVKPNSIYESNCLIWVEGPSDKLYIEFWLKKYCEQSNGEFIFPQEGLKYTYQYYAGALIDDYMFCDESDAEKDKSVVNALLLHPNIYIYADSDKNKPSADYKHKRLKKLLQELHNSDRGDRIWISHSKEIEGYLPENFYKQLARKGNKSIDETLQLDKDDYYLPIHEIINKFRNDSQQYLKSDPKKVEMAEEYIRIFETKPCKELCNQWFQDNLWAEMKKLYNFIIQSNPH